VQVHATVHSGVLSGNKMRDRLQVLLILLGCIPRRRTFCLEVLVAHPGFDREVFHRSRLTDLGFTGWDPQRTYE
jgi:hypothetical protein